MTNGLPNVPGGMTPAFGGRMDIYDIQRVLEEIARESPERIEITMDKRPENCYYTMFYVRKSEGKVG